MENTTNSQKIYLLYLFKNVSLIVLEILAILLLGPIPLSITLLIGWIVFKRYYKFTPHFSWH